ncbi:hypothetical protein SELMODRAFT_418075 [Selaginella moellendorffii]|uniref:Uncharacterized protein n=1 Tax=Selaginella moellendorffii TaxID=88036 RepID=D8S4K4_SELML|nr:hypothetical protein SELMODRAFT_418075 [Selaginella moellendorffii]
MAFSSSRGEHTLLDTDVRCTWQVEASELPTESGHEGGQLEMRHGKKSVTFDFSGADSKTRCDLSALRGVQRQLKEWAEEMKDVSSPILAIPRSHKYSNNSLSFVGLKGHDRVVAALVLSCIGFLDVLLCMLVKHTTSNRVFNTFETDYSVGNWTTIDDKKLEHFTRETGYEGREQIEVLCATQSVRGVVNWLEEQHKREPGRTSGDLERYVDALSDSKETKVGAHEYRSAGYGCHGTKSMDGSGVIEGLLQKEDKGHGIKLLAEEKVCKNYLFLIDLLSVFVETGREDEAWKILGSQKVGRAQLSSHRRVLGDSDNQRGYRSIYYPTSRSETVINKKEKLAELQQKGRKQFLGMVVLELEYGGCHNAAMVFAKKRFIKDVDFEEIYGGLSEIENDDAHVLILAFDEKFHDAVKKVTDMRLEYTVVTMKRAEGLFGLKLFSELLSRALVHNSHMAEVAIWLGNKEIVESIVKRVRSGRSKLLEDEKDYNRKSWDDVARDGLKKVINAKICYLSRNEDDEVSSSNETDDEMDEDEDEEDEKENKRRRLNPRLERLRIENSGAKIERLRKLLNYLA